MTALDVFVIGLTWYEWDYLKKKTVGDTLGT